eukprot:COSAG01_NODE_48533_length_380_cov_1.099644_1_plen_75_part_10
MIMMGANSTSCIPRASLLDRALHPVEEVQHIATVAPYFVAHDEGVDQPQNARAISVEDIFGVDAHQLDPGPPHEL